MPALGIAAVISFLTRSGLVSTCRRSDRGSGVCRSLAHGSLAVQPSGESRSVAAIRYLTLVRRMLVKMHATDALERAVQAVVGPDRNFRILLTVASIVFLIGGLGTRCLGLWPVSRPRPAVDRCANGPYLPGRHPGHCDAVCRIDRAVPEFDPDLRVWPVRTVAVHSDGRAGLTAFQSPPHVSSRPRRSHCAAFRRPHTTPGRRILRRGDPR